MIGTKLVRVPTERVNLSMDRTALSAARAAAQANGMSLSEWLSKAAWDRAIWEAARHSAEQSRRHPDELANWEDERLDRLFGGDQA